MGELAALLGSAAGIGGTAIDAIGAAYEGEATKAAAVYNAKLSKAQAAAQAEKVRSDASRIRGENIVRVAKSGVRMEGSALQVMTRNAYQTEKQAQTILRAGKAAASLYRMEGEAALTASRFRVASAVMRGLGSMASPASGGLGALGGGAGGAGSGGGSGGGTS